MKRVCAILALAALAGTIAQAQVTQVVSRNAVGYVKLEPTGNGNFVLGAVPFYEVGDNNGDAYTIGEILGLS